MQRAHTGRMCFRELCDHRSQWPVRCVVRRRHRVSDWGGWTAAMPAVLSSMRYDGPADRLHWPGIDGLSGMPKPRVRWRLLRQLPRLLRARPMRHAVFVNAGYCDVCVGQPRVPPVPPTVRQLHRLSTSRLHDLQVASQLGRIVRFDMRCERVPGRDAMPRLQRRMLWNMHRAVQHPVSRGDGGGDGATMPWRNQIVK